MQEGPKDSKMELQKTLKIKPFSEPAKTTESCSRLHAELVFEVWRAPKPHFFQDHFRKPSSCCTGTLVFQIFDKNDAPESVQNRSKILPKMKQQTRWKKYVKSGGGQKMQRRRQGRSLKIRRAVLAQLLGVLGAMYNYFYIFCSASDFSH